MKATRSVLSGVASTASPSIARITASVLTLLALAGCNGGGAAGVTPGLAVTQTSIQIQGASPSLTVGETVDLAPLVTVVGTANTGVSWAVQEGAAGGGIDASGAYTAPTVLGTYHVVVTSQADTAVTVTIPIDVGPVMVTVTPQGDVLGRGGVRTYAARTTAVDQQVTWKVAEGTAGGSISGNRYTASNNTGTYHVTATSVRDPSASASATVTVVAAGFQPGPEMTTPRLGHSATSLPDGRVLITGGGEFNTDCSGPWDYGPDPCSLASAELYDPASGTFADAGPMQTLRGGSTATLLPNGKVLVIGGEDSLGPYAELYDPATGTFASTGGVNGSRIFHSATLLANGKVLVAGGMGLSAAAANSSNYLPSMAELYDPQTETFTATSGGGMIVPRLSHTATLLPDGRVLLAGGSSYAQGTAISAAELYDPITGMFTATASMSKTRYMHRATLLTDGTVLITGGAGSYGPLNIANTAEIYDPTSGQFGPTGNMMEGRQAHVAILLPNGKVLIAGGDCYASTSSACYADGGYFSFTAELYDPDAGAFTQTGGMAAALVGPVAVLLDDGRVLVSGGAAFGSTELYH